MQFRSVFTLIVVVRFEMSLALLPSIVSEWPTIFDIYILVEKVHSMVQAALAVMQVSKHFSKASVFVQRIRSLIRWNF